jgi:glycerol-3-phosphate dehydrogenase (NAD(P)+)
MSSGSNVLVLGYGEMGHAMERLLSASHSLRFWDIQPIEGLEVIALETAVADADFILYCVPVTPLGELAARVCPHLSPGSVSLSVAKGLDERGRPAPAILAEVYAGEHHYGVLYGPMIAEEIIRGRMAFAQVGCSSADIYTPIGALYANTGLVLEYSADTTGIAWSSLLKNVYAMLFGVTDELSMGDNVRGYLAVAALREMADIVEGMGGQPTSVQQLAGLGDLVTTATSASSHHHELGRQLVRGTRDGISGEGVHTLAMVETFHLFDSTAFPLFTLMQDIIGHPQAAQARIEAYLASL